MAQLSPGELSKAHAALEGIANCSQCHESGREISGVKCLECHVEIKQGLDAKAGFHFLSSGSSCVTCHKEHLGRNARITQFDESKFDHPRTGLSLVGKHGSLKCEQCHIGKFITSADVRKTLNDHPRKTFLGLEQRCVTCHTDRHKGTVSQDCRTCHTADGWKPAAMFNHSKAKFALTGKHKPIECGKCHSGMSSRGPSESILFATKDFSDCKPCHTSAHPAKFVDKTCKSCHNAEGWRVVTAVNHAETRYPLVGKHLTVGCDKCHVEMGLKRGQAVNFRTKAFGDCKPCHDSPHRFALVDRQCKSCHMPTAWSAPAVVPFDHSLTRYVLKGKHASLRCEKCHKPTTQSPAFPRTYFPAFARCADCHADFHKGQFTRKYSDNCAACHTESGYKPSVFSIKQHIETRFPLDGAHAAVPCNDCHRRPGQTGPSFTFTSVRCESCHPDKHKGQFNRFTKEAGCTRCHSLSDWKNPAFDHLSTKFKLEGKHASVRCQECHKEQVVAGVKGLKYEGTVTDCQSCHKDQHVGQFAVGGVTKCEPCHSPVSWRTLLFNHEVQSNFQLTGAHLRVPCGKCHNEEKTIDQKVIRYKPLPTKCESCHPGVVK
jgi:hypothetical protein